MGVSVLHIHEVAVLSERKGGLIPKPPLSENMKLFFSHEKYKKMKVIISFRIFPWGSSRA